MTWGWALWWLLPWRDLLLMQAGAVSTVAILWFVWGLPLCRARKFIDSSEGQLALEHEERKRLISEAALRARTRMFDHYLEQMQKSPSATRRELVEWSSDVGNEFEAISGRLVLEVGEALTEPIRWDR